MATIFAVFSAIELFLALLPGGSQITNAACFAAALLFALWSIVEAIGNRA